jgi:autophagy-related protein 9
VEGLGSVCSYSLFDFAKYGNARYGAEADGREIHKEGPARDGKMEKSFLNFKVRHRRPRAGGT